jgi:hypothetical protein
MQLLLDAAFSRGLVSSRDIEVNIRKKVCDDQNRSCMERSCVACECKIVHDPGRLSPLPFTFYQWEKVKNNGFQVTDCQMVGI